MYKVTKRQSRMALGGTFDHFHKGHESFIKYAFKYGYRLVIGITDKRLSQSKDYLRSIQPYKVRAKAVRNFCEKNDMLFEIVTLTDPYGPTIDRENKRIDSICVTPETLIGAEKINEIREASNMRELAVFVAPMVRDDQNKPLSSTTIRSGKVSRRGMNYAANIKSDIEIDSNQRAFFSKPLGPIVSQGLHRKTEIVAVVGDYALTEFIKKNRSYTVGVYDKKTQREPFESEQLKDITSDINFDNPAGFISKASLDALSKLDFKSQKHILVNGEEDLITVSLVLTMPLDSLIYYGQPDRGMVLLKVTEDFKERIYKLLTK